MNLTRWSKSAFAAALFSIATAACSSDPLDPVPGRLDAVYVATSVGGESLPRRITGVDSWMTLVADTISFYSNATAIRRTVIKATDGGSGPETLQHLESKLSYAIDGIRLILTPVCGPTELCIGPVTGTIIPARVILPSSLLGTTAGELVLTRVAQ